MRILVSTLALILSVLVVGVRNADAEEPEQPSEPTSHSRRHTNSLVHETSPYLLQHAHNPVDWYPWGKEAFAIAQRDQKPIFLSVGYSTCYWCQVMERKVFQDPDIARDLNERFVCIKVDREQRPEIDHVYMIALQIMTGNGGWPMNIFLTPPASASQKSFRAAGTTTDEQQIGYGLKPFFCATYLPPIADDGRPGFPEVIDSIHTTWETKQAHVLQQAHRLAALVSDVMTESNSSGPLDQSLAVRATRKILKSYDPANGGLGTSKKGPKFPEPSKLRFLLKLSQSEAGETLSEAADPSEAVLKTLDRMALGGIYDHVGGGFHRYATDGKWIVPHFEKMLCDNGQLLTVYAEALQILRRRDATNSARASRYERVLRETSDYLLREMTDPTGAFWSAQSAEVNGVEGASYLWNIEQLNSAIADPELASLAIDLYGLAAGTNFQDPHLPDAQPANVLFLAKPLSEFAVESGLPIPQLLEKRLEINAQLKSARDKRQQPGVDDKVLVAWNGLAIEGLATAGAVLGEPSYIEAAQQAAEAILQRMASEDGGLYRTMRNGECRMPALLTDYSHFTAGLLTLSRVQEDNEKLLEEAERLTRYAIELFSTDSGGYYDSMEEAAELFVRVRVTYDDALPSGNSIMTHNLLRLYQTTDKQEWLQRVTRDLRSFSEDMQKNGHAMPAMLSVLLELFEIEPASELLTALAED